MSFQALDSFKSVFTFNFPTAAIQFNSKEFQALLTNAYELYDSAARSYKKVQLRGNTLTEFSCGVIELAKDGFTVQADERSVASGGGSYALNFVKPSSLQASDREWIKDLIQDSYLSKIEANQKALKAQLKANVLAEDKQKESEKLAAQRAKLEAAAEKKAEVEYEALLAQFEASQEAE